MDNEMLFVEWLDALIYEMATRKMLFRRFQVEICNHALRAEAWGEPIDVARHRPGVEIKGATLTELRVDGKPGTVLVDEGRFATLLQGRGKHEVQVGRPMALCNPVTKIHEERETPAQNKRAHLVCYGIEQSFQGLVAYSNQFGDGTMNLRRIFGLCVPSTKELIDEP